jgi:hypothetical protein
MRQAIRYVVSLCLGGQDYEALSKSDPIDHDSELVEATFRLVCVENSDERLEKSPSTR